MRRQNCSVFSFDCNEQQSGRLFDERLERCAFKSQLEAGNPALEQLLIA